MPKLVKPSRSIKAITTATRHPAPPKPAPQTITTDYITHSEVVLVNESGDKSLRESRSRDPSTNFGASDPAGLGESETREVNPKLYGPDKMRTEDFRGPQGNMCVGNAYTTAWGERKDGAGGGGGDGVKPWFGNQGPFEKLNLEVGIRYGKVRMRVKLDYRCKKGGWKIGKEKKLWLEGVTVCR